jgi:hypothetical protein
VKREERGKEGKRERGKERKKERKEKGNERKIWEMRKGEGTWRQAVMVECSVYMYISTATTTSTLTD